VKGMVHPRRKLNRKPQAWHGKDLRIISKDRIEYLIFI
jgi:hypothetical protein